MVNAMHAESNFIPERQEEMEYTLNRPWSGRTRSAIRSERPFKVCQNMRGIYRPNFDFDPKEYIENLPQPEYGLFHELAKPNGLGLKNLSPRKIDKILTWIFENRAEDAHKINAEEDTVLTCAFNGRFPDQNIFNFAISTYFAGALGHNPPEDWDTPTFNPQTRDRTLKQLKDLDKELETPRTLWTESLAKLINKDFFQRQIRSTIKAENQASRSPIFTPYSEVLLSEKNPDKFNISLLYKKMDALAGLYKTKVDLHYLGEQIIRDAETASEQQTSTIGRNIVVTGSPGTGKSTVAKLMGGLLACEGVVSEKKIIIIDANGLPLEDENEFQLNVEKLFEAASDGVLIVDNAHVLAKKANTSALMLFNELENAAPQQTIVILAGDAEGIGALLSPDRGLREHFLYRFKLDGFYEDDLKEIFLKEVQKAEFVFPPDVKIDGVILQKPSEDIIAHAMQEILNAKEDLGIYFENAKTVQEYVREIKKKVKIETYTKLTEQNIWDRRANTEPQKQTAKTLTLDSLAFYDPMTGKFSQTPPKAPRPKGDYMLNPGANTKRTYYL